MPADEQPAPPRPATPNSPYPPRPPVVDPDTETVTAPIGGRR